MQLTCFRVLAAPSTHRILHPQGPFRKLPVLCLSTARRQPPNTIAPVCQSRQEWEQTILVSGEVLWIQILRGTVRDDVPCGGLTLSILRVEGGTALRSFLGTHMLYFSVTPKCRP